MEKEETEKRGNKLMNIIAGSVFGVAAFLVSGCDYMVGYSTYGPYYPRTYYEHRIIEPFSHPSYSYPRYINPPSHRYSPSRPPIIRPSPPSIRPSPYRPSPPTIRPSPNRPSRPNSPHRDRR